jgi:hypothetical protein
MRTVQRVCSQPDYKPRASRALGTRKHELRGKADTTPRAETRNKLRVADLRDRELKSCEPGGFGSFGGVASASARPFESQLLHAVSQRARAQTEQLGSATITRDAVVAAAQGVE